MCRSLILALSSLLALTASLAHAQAPAATPEAASPSSPNEYARPASWLCRPDKAHDACEVDLTTTVVSAAGKLTQERWKANRKAPIDCFYVYPTVSLDPGTNSDMNAGGEELSVVKHQLARFGSQCRLFAPLYRQITLTALRSAVVSGKPAPEANFALAYRDVLAAWNYYLEHDNQGRGVVLIGHSQGSRMLTALIQHELDGKPEQAKLISALLLGTSLAVPKDKDVGGGFKHIPLCRAPSQVGCALAYASFRDTAPPPADSRYGRVTEPGMVAACVNPAALSGGSGELHAYLAAAHSPGSASLEPKPWVTPARPIDTPFVSVPGLLSAQCVTNEHGSYLAITVHGDPADPRVDDIVGDVVVNGQVQRNWGLHLIDVHLTLGNLVELVGQQAKGYLEKQRPQKPRS